jgi:ribosomal protein S18 acetylase RimI-like enzyme
VEIRELDRARDRRGVEAIDTTFETASVFDLVSAPRALELVVRPLAAPIAKRYSTGEVFATWARWDKGWVAHDGDEIHGFATVAYEAWHERLVLWFLYIAPAWRQRGIGRALLEHVEAHGRRAGATHVWLETSSVNVPGVTPTRASATRCAVPTRSTTARTCRARPRSTSPRCCDAGRPAGHGPTGGHEPLQVRRISVTQGRSSTCWTARRCRPIHLYSAPPFGGAARSRKPDLANSTQITQTDQPQCRHSWQRVWTTSTEPHSGQLGGAATAAARAPVTSTWPSRLPSRYTVIPLQPSS